MPVALRRRDGDTTWSRLASDVTAAAELAEELEVELAETRRDLMDSRKAQRRAEQERDEAVEARFTAKTVLEALTVARFGTQRTWADSDGKRKLFRRHITLGHGVDTQRCAQIYYDVGSDGRVEVAWVGEHRPTVSEDT